MDKAIKHYEQSIELNSANPKFYLCYARALYEKVQNLEKDARRRPILEKAKRFLEQGLLGADPNMQREMKNYLFLINESLAEMHAPKKRADRPSVN